jgi:Tol biopolymer transport system component
MKRPLFQLAGSAIVAILLAPVSPALAQSPCAISQITHSAWGNTGQVVLSGDGRRIAAVSSANLTGQTEPYDRIYLLDVPSGAVIPLTPGTSGSSREVDIDGDGSRVVFESGLDLIGGNPDRNSEVFLYDDATRTLHQVTSTASTSRFNLPFSGQARISSDGQTLAYVITVLGPASVAHLYAAGETAPGEVAIYPSLSGDGRRAAYQSWQNLTGENPDGSYELFLWDIDTGNLTQITHNEGFAGYDLDADGSRLALVSSGDLVSGGNPDRNLEVFVYDVPTGRFLQVTRTTGDVIVSAPSLNAAGTRVAFVATADLVAGRNPDRGSEVFLSDVDLGTTVQVTSLPAGRSIGEPSISEDGSAVAFSSSGDLVPGGNPDGNYDVFLASCPVAELVLHGRFQVTASWRVPGGAEGLAWAVRLSEQAGYFWFFAPDNPEITVKVIDACGIPLFDNYWVFAAGMTNVEVTLKVRDGVTGEERMWTQPGGQPFRPIQDTWHFRVCG